MDLLKLKKAKPTNMAAKAAMQISPNVSPHPEKNNRTKTNASTNNVMKTYDTMLRDFHCGPIASRVSENSLVANPR